MKDLLAKIDKNQQLINSFRPLKKEEVAQIKEYYRIGMTYSSNAIEGNSLTDTETKVVLEDGITIGGKPLKDHYEASGHSDAFDYLYKLAKKQEVGETDVKRFHQLFYHRIDAENAGKYRKIKIFVTGAEHSFPNYTQVPKLMKEFIISIKELRGKKHPVELAAITHKDFVNIHPFVDGNGRVARLLMNLILLQEGYNIALISPVLRVQYLQAIKKSYRDDKDFIKFIAEAVYETQKEYIRLMK